MVRGGKLCFAALGRGGKCSTECVLSPQVTKVTQVDGNSPVRFSTETTFVVDKYEIL